MKSALSLILFFLTLTVAVAQSESFLTLKDKFRGKENVFSFGASGFFAKSILWMAGEDEARDIFRDIRHVRMIVIPKEAFKEENVTLGGFKKFATRHDNYQEVLSIRDHGDDISLMLQEPEAKTRNSRYLLLIDDHDEVLAFELVGELDPKAMKDAYNRSKNNKG